MISKHIIINETSLIKKKNTINKKWKQIVPIEINLAYYICMHHKFIGDYVLECKICYILLNHKYN